ncbi:MAG TPA: phosphatase PAP2 family protein [Rhodanobacteraceae bacterium]|nr:phosphatase PAP2 family protein [Rhodanobacteraceae bacterium]
MLSPSGTVPFLVKEPSIPLCAGFLLAFLLRYLLKERRRDIRIALIAFFCLVGSVGTYSIAAKEGGLINTRYDLYVYRIDQLLHINEPGAAMGRVLLAHWWGVWGINFVYGFITAAVMLLLVAYTSRPEYREVLYAILLNLAIAPFLYAAIPVSGPQFAFGSFPVLPAFVTPHIIYMHSAPNGVPSVHFSTALLIWWYSRKWLWPLLSASAFLLLTEIATLASGQHYVFDLIAAVPYTAGAVLTATALCQRQRAGHCSP